MSMAMSVVAGMDLGSSPPAVALTPATPTENTPAAVTETATTAISDPNAMPPGPMVTMPAPLPEHAFTEFHKTPGKPERNRLSRQLARFAWIMPLAAISLASVTFSVRASYPRIAILVDAVNGGLLFIGLLCATVALASGRRSARKGILFPAATGLFFSGGFVGLVIGWMTVSTPTPPVQSVAISEPARAPAVEAPKPAAPTQTAPTHQKTTPKLDMSDPARTGREGMSKHAGWYGAATAKGATISIGEFAAAAPVVAELRALFGAHPNVLLIGIDNSRGRAALSIDPSSLRAESADGRRILALPVHTVLETAESNRDHLLALFNHFLQAAPGQSAIYGFAFLPAETDLRAIDRVSLVLNGNRVVLPGQYLSAGQKAELARQAEAQASR
jgi:hypothetical protein